jgi:HPt (histidine-containing phosphotransfer) domain-containing protein
MTNNLRNYDLTYLEELSAGDPAFIKSIILQFLDEAPLVLSKIKLHLEQKNWNDLHYQVHKFAPNLAFIGIVDIKEEVNKLEFFAKNKTDLDSIPALVNIITQRCELAISSLKQDFEF